MVLDRINGINDIHKIPLDEFDVLAHEIREKLVTSISQTGGHLGPNLGVVELTLAIHNVLDLNKDKVIWDVGHQSYVHKILTGRKDLSTLRQKGGISGFPKREESLADCFNTGHSSNSISAGLGLVKARDLQGEDYTVISVIGDGALTGGMAYEALNNAAEINTNFIIIINDNKMSISKNVGGISSSLGMLRTTKAYTGIKHKIKKGLKKVPIVGEEIVNVVGKATDGIKQLVLPNMLFENLGLTYLGTVNGHNTIQLMRVINEAKKVKGAVVIHVLTEKGHGYKPAVLNPDKFHGVGPFYPENGNSKGKSLDVTYTEIFGKKLTQLCKNNKKIVGITAAMPDGTGISYMQNEFPERVFDVGIAEEHGVTFAAGLATGGMIPVVAIYSSFLQRAVDQILEDVCLQNLHVIFAIDRAGIVGQDGATHQGTFDISFLSMIPNMTIIAPKNGRELEMAMDFAVNYNGPIAIRYPRGKAFRELADSDEIIYGKSQCLIEGEKTAIIAIGSMVENSYRAVTTINQKGHRLALYNGRFVKPMDTELIDNLAKSFSKIITIEESVSNGSFGQMVAAYVENNNYNIRVNNINIGDRFVEHGSVGELHKDLNIDEKGLEKTIEELIL